MSKYSRRVEDAVRLAEFLEEKGRVVVDSVIRMAGDGLELVTLDDDMGPLESSGSSSREPECLFLFSIRSATLGINSSKSS